MLGWGPCPTSAVRPGPTHHLLSVTAVKPGRPRLASVIFTIYFTVAKVRAGECRRQRCWTCALRFRVGLPQGAAFLFHPGQRRRSVIVAVCLALGARPCAPWWRGVLCAHQRRLLPVPQRRRVDSRSTSLTEEQEVLKKKKKKLDWSLLSQSASEV